MQYYELPLPLFANNGEGYQKAHGYFAAALLKRAGGYTAHDAWGIWEAPDGKVFEDMNRVYRFAVSDTPLARAILSDAGQWFPDQSALFLARIGTGANGKWSEVVDLVSGDDLTFRLNNAVSGMRAARAFNEPEGWATEEKAEETYADLAPVHPQPDLAKPSLEGSFRASPSFAVLAAGRAS